MTEGQPFCHWDGKLKDGDKRAVLLSRSPLGTSCLRHKVKMVIGITGGVGSGKSKVLTWLKNKYGAMVLAADDVAREISETEGPALDAIRDLFRPLDALTADGVMDRPKVAALVFKEPALKKALEDILHPATVSYIAEKAQENNELTIVESAILFESKMDKLCDFTVFIYADRETRIDRLMSSRGYTREKCEAVMASQKSDSFFKESCTEIIDNSFDFEKTAEQIDRMLAARGIYAAER